MYEGSILFTFNKAINLIMKNISNAINIKHYKGQL